MNKTLGFIACIFFLFIFSCGSLEDLIEGNYRETSQKTSNNIIKLDEDQRAQNIAVENSYIVTFKATESNQQTKFQNFFSETKNFHDEIVGNFIADPRISNMSFLSSFSLGEEDENDFDVKNFVPPHLKHIWANDISKQKIAAMVQVDFRTDEDAESILEDWSQSGKILFAEPNYISKPDGYWEEQYKLYETGEAYWYKSIDLLGAFQSLAGISTSADDKPIIAVLDSGVQTAHPELTKSLWKNGYTGLSDCGSEDVHGCNTVSAEYGTLGNGNVEPKEGCDAGSSDPCSHGTHVTGIIVGTFNTNRGGVCPICQVMSVRIVNDKGTIQDSSIIRGLKYISMFKKSETKTNAVRVANASFGKFVRSRAVATLVRKLRDSNGLLLVAAAGNEDTNKYQYPAALPEAIAVTNIKQDDTKHPTSNFGRWVNVAAPGDNIYATLPGGGSNTKSGTSMSAPLVSGVAGLILAAKPTISYDGLRAAILESANPSKLYSPAINKNYLVHVTATTGQIPLLGAGVLDANAAINNKKAGNQYVVSAKDRVDGLCGVINHNTYNTTISSKLIIVLLLMLPFIVAVITYNKKNYKVKL